MIFQYFSNIFILSSLTHCSLTETEKRHYYHPRFASSTVEFLLIAQINKEYRVWLAYVKQHKGVSCPKILLDSKGWKYIASQCQIQISSVSPIFLREKS